VNLFGGGTGASLLRGWADTPEHYVQLAPSTTLDRVLSGRYAGQRLLVIVDVEGAELSALRGAAELLARDPKPLWMVEIIVSQTGGVGPNQTILETFECFWRAGYDAYTTEPQHRKIERQEVEAIAAGGRDTLNSANIFFVDPIHADLLMSAPATL
jgi:hypothetical protein